MERRGEVVMRKEQLDDGVAQQFATSLGPALNKAALDSSYYQFLQDARNMANVATAAGIIPAWVANVAVNLIGADVCIVMGGDPIECIAKTWG
jgi:hypothetical protein